MVKYFLENGADPSIEDATGRDAIGVAHQMDLIEKEKMGTPTYRLGITSIQEWKLAKVQFPLAQTNFSDQFIECQDEKVPIHRVCYVLCPELKQNSLKNYNGLVVKMLRHFLYTNELTLDNINVVDVVHLYELSLVLSLPQLSNRVLKLIPTVLTVKNFDQGYTVAFESDHNDFKKMDSLIFLFQNFYLDNQRSITPLDNLHKKILNLVRSKTEVTIGDDNFGKVIRVSKEKLWKSKEYKDLTLICSDGISIGCHKAVVGISPVFSRFDQNMDPNHYVVDFKGKPLLLFFEMLYAGKVLFQGVALDVLFDLYHICNQNECKDMTQIVTQHLLSILNEKNYCRMLDFCISSGPDEKFLFKIQEYIKSRSPSELCSMYAICREKNQEILNDLVLCMVSAINRDTCISWLSALDEHGINDQDLWYKLLSSMNPDTFQLWTILQSKITKLKHENETQIAILKESFNEERNINKRKRDDDESELKNGMKSIIERLDHPENLNSKKKMKPYEEAEKK